MKTNLQSVFGTDEGLEVDGKWFEVTDEVSFKLKRFGGRNSAKGKKLRALYLKPHARKIQNDTITAELETEIYVKIFVELSLTDWKGILDFTNKLEGEEVPFSKERAISLLCDMPDLLEELMALAQNSDEYREDLGNS